MAVVEMEQCHTWQVWTSAGKGLSAMKSVQSGIMHGEGACPAVHREDAET